MIRIIDLPSLNAKMKIEFHVEEDKVICSGMILQGENGSQFALSIDRIEAMKLVGMINGN